MPRPDSIPTGALRVGYVTKMYPRFSETFVVNEVRGLERRGVEIEMRPAALALPVGRDVQVAQDGEQPGLQVAVGPAQAPARQRPFQRVLHQVVGRVVVADQRIRIAAQRRDQRFEQGLRIGHHKPPPPS